MRERAQIGFLDDVLGLAVIAQDAAGKPVKPAIVRLNDDADGGFVAGAGALDQFGVAVRDGSVGGFLRCSGVAHHDFARSVDRLLLTLDAAKPNRFPRPRQILKSLSEVRTPRLPLARDCGRKTGSWPRHPRP